MTSLEEDIVDLEEKIVVYEKELAEATTPEEKTDLREMVTSTSDTFNRLLDQLRAQARESQAPTWVADLATLLASLYELILRLDTKFGRTKTMVQGSSIACTDRRRHFQVERLPFVTAAHDFKTFDSDEHRSALAAVVATYQTFMRNSADQDETRVVQPEITTRFWPAVCNALRDCEMLRHLFETCEMVDGKAYSYTVVAPGEVLVVDGAVDHALCLKDSPLCCLPLEDQSIGAQLVATRTDKSCSPEIAQALCVVRAEVERINRTTAYVPEEYVGLLQNGIQWIAVSQKLVRGTSYCLFFVASDVADIVRLLEHALCTAAIVARQIYDPNQRPQRRTVSPRPFVEKGGDNSGKDAPPPPSDTSTAHHEAQRSGRRKVGKRRGRQQSSQNDYFVLPLTAANLASHFAADK